MNETIDLMKKHTSVRRFTEEPISEKELRAIIDAGRAASSSNLIRLLLFAVKKRKQPCLIWCLRRLFVSHLFFFFLSETSIELRKVCDFIRIPFTHKEWRIF